MVLLSHLDNMLSDYQHLFKLKTWLMSRLNAKLPVAAGFPNYTYRVRVYPQDDPHKIHL